MRLKYHIKLYRRWLRLWGTLPVYNWIRAAGAYRGGNHRLALELYQRGLRRHPDHPAHYCARLDMAYCCQKLGDLKRAQDLLNFVAENLPHSKEANSRLAQMMFRCGGLSEAVAVLRRALKYNPGDPRLVALFLMAALENGGPESLISEAVYAFRMLKTKDLDLPLVQSAKAALWIFQGEGKRARELLLELVDEDSAPLEAFLLLAEELIRAGHSAVARQQLRRALGLDPNHPRLLTLLAESYLCPGAAYNPEYALQLALNAAQQSDWSSCRELGTLALAYSRVGDKMAALVSAERAVELSRRHCRIRNGRELDKLIEDLSRGTQA